jgi:hypothetical protein
MREAQPIDEALVALASEAHAHGTLLSCRGEQQPRDDGDENSFTFDELRAHREVGRLCRPISPRAAGALTATNGTKKSCSRQRASTRTLGAAGVIDYRGCWFYWVECKGQRQIMARSKLRFVVCGLLTAVALGGACSNDQPKKQLSDGCVQNSDCSGSLVCSFGHCHAACKKSKDCPSAERCVKDSSGSTVCQQPNEVKCLYNSDCTAPLVCPIDGQCRNQCRTDRDCVSGQLCTIELVCAEATEIDPTGHLIVGGVAGAAGSSGSNQAGNTNSAGNSNAGGSTSVGGAS